MVMHYPLRHTTIVESVCQINCIKRFCAQPDQLFKMVQKMQTYDKMSTTKGHPWEPRESQVYELRSPNVERNNMVTVMLC